MKTVILIFSAVICFNVYAQEKTLLAGGITHGGYGGPEVKFAQVGDNLGILVGGKGGWIINHTIVIGGGGYGLVNNIKADAVFNDRPAYLNFGYGGLILEYIQNSDELLHYTFSALIGGGSASLRDRNLHQGEIIEDTQNFFILEPGANAEANIASFFRINLGASYRFLSNVSIDRFDQENLGGLSANLTFKFGKF